MNIDKKFVLRNIVVLALLAILQSCSNVPVNIGLAKNEVVKYHKTGKYNSELNNVISSAKNSFKNLVVKKGDVVVFDVDETSLSNYEFIKDKLGFGYVTKLWNDWLDKADAPAIEQVKSLYDFLVEKDVKIVFLTGRKDFQYKATIKNLKNAGYLKFDTLITRLPSEYKLSALEYKSKKRSELTKKGYHIIGDVGDQWSDLNGPDHGIQVKIPNYLYIIK